VPKLVTVTEGVRETVGVLEVVPDPDKVPLTLGVPELVIVTEGVPEPVTV